MAKKSISGTTKSDRLYLKNKLAILLAFFVTAATLQSNREIKAKSVLHLPPRLQALIDSTVAETYNYNFTPALAITDSMIARYPGRPEGYIYKCGIYSKMLAESYFRHRDSVWNVYRRIVDRACKLSKDRVKAHPDDVDDLFHYASALVYRSRYEAAKSDWLGLMSDGVRSRKLLERAIGLDSTFYDAYSGIGAFNYYAAHLPWYLKPVALILGIQGNERKGIADLKKAAQLGFYARAESASFLADIVYKEKKNYRVIARIALRLHTQYPGNLDFVRSLCFAYYKMNDFEQVVHYADPVLARYGGPDSTRFRSLAFIRFYRGEAYAALRRNYDLAIADYSRTIEMGESSMLVSRAYYGRGSIYERLGLKRKAVLDFKTAIRLNGDYNACKLARAALDSLEVH